MSRVTNEINKISMAVISISAKVLFYAAAATFVIVGAKKEAQIKEAEGQAEAILKVQEATAEGIRKINESNPQNGVLTLKSLEALEKVADGKATKLIIPSDIQAIAGLATSLKEIIKED